MREETPAGGAGELLTGPGDRKFYLLRPGGTSLLLEVGTGRGSECQGRRAGDSVGGPLPGRWRDGETASASERGAPDPADFTVTVAEVN